MRRMDGVSVLYFFNDQIMAFYDIRADFILHFYDLIEDDFSFCFIIKEFSINGSPEVCVCP